MHKIFGASQFEQPRLSNRIQCTEVFCFGTYKIDEKAIGEISKVIIDSEIRKISHSYENRGKLLKLENALKSSVLN